MNTKLFKKLNEQMEINQSVDKPISESERNKVETELIFGDLTESINDNMNLCEGKSMHIVGGSQARGKTPKSELTYSFTTTKDKNGNITGKTISSFDPRRQKYSKDYPVDVNSQTADEATFNAAKKRK